MVTRRVKLVLRNGNYAEIPPSTEQIISSCLGPAPNMPLSEACSLGSIALLDWMWESSCVSASDRTPWWSLANYLRSEPHYYRWQFGKCVEIAVKRGDVAVLEWLLLHFRDCEVPSVLVDEAASKGHLHILQSLWRHDGGQRDRETRSVKTRKVVTSSGEAFSQRCPGKNTVKWGHTCLRNAVQNRQHDVVRWLHGHVPLDDEGAAQAIKAAMDSGDMDLAKFLLPVGRCLLDYAELTLNPHMIEWMLDCGYLQRDGAAAASAIRNLAYGANLPLMQRIAALQDPPSDGPLWYECWARAMFKACEVGQLRTFRWLVEHPIGRQICQTLQGLEHFSDFAMKALDRNRERVEMLQYLYEQGSTIEGDFYKVVVLDAIQDGKDLDVVKWLIDRTPICMSSQFPAYCVMDEAAKAGRLEMLQFFQRLQLSSFTQHALEMSGQRQQQHRGPNDYEDNSSGFDPWRRLCCSSDAMNEAAANGHLEVVKWLHLNQSEGCTRAAMDKAASHGHLKVVKWLHLNRSEGCTRAAMDKAASHGHLEVVKWLHLNRSEGCTTYAVDGAARNGHLETVKWLQSSLDAACMTTAMDGAAYHGHMEVVKWLHANTSTGCTTQAIDFAARGGHLETIKWLFVNRSEGCTASAIEEALRKGYLRVANWLQAHYPQHPPAKLYDWTRTENAFEELLFREEHYGNIFCANFLQTLRKPDRSNYRTVNGEVVRWVDEKYL